MCVPFCFIVQAAQLPQAQLVFLISLSGLICLYKYNYSHVRGKQERDSMKDRDRKEREG